MDAVSDPAILEIWVMKSAQVGYTEALNNVVGYHIDQDPAPMLMVQPTVEIAEAWSKDRLAPMLRDSPSLRGRVKDVRSRDSGNTLLHKQFPGGHITIAGANAPSGLASRPIRITLFDEVDRYPVSAGTEGDPISLGKKRSTTFWNKKFLAGSTPTIKGASRIEAGFEGSDMRFYEVPCPRCNEFQRLVWSQVRWPDGNPSAAVYVCKHCTAELRDVDKPEMLKRGRWTASKPFNGLAGFHISELYSPWVKWGEMATAFLIAKRLPSTLQTWVNTALGETWEAKGEAVDGSSIKDRKEPYGPDSLPNGVVELTVGVDTQDDRLEWQLVGWGARDHCWVIEHHVERGNPGAKDVWDALTKYRQRTFITESGRVLQIDAVCVDTGGHYTQEAYKYCYKHRFERVFAIKGAAGLGRLVWPKKPGKAKGSRCDLFIIGVDTAKDLLYQRLSKVISASLDGYIHFPASVDDAWFDGLTSEQKFYKEVQGRRVAFFRPKKMNAPQEPLDCWIYAYAAMLARSLKLDDISKAVEAKYGSAKTETVADDAVAEVEQPEQPPKPPPAPRPNPPSRGRWVTTNRGSWFNRYGQRP
jgi:phage terminase large subunit GpA-like protein